MIDDKKEKKGLDGIESPDAPIGMDAYVEDSAIVPVEEGSAPLAAYSETPDFDAADVQPPKLRLAQGLTPEVVEGNATVGQWLIPGLEPFDAITIVPLAFAKRRENWDEDRGVVCSSNDSLVGVGDPGGQCEFCDDNKWADDAKGKRKPPLCTFMYQYFVYVHEADTVVLLTFRKTSIGVGRMMNSIVAQRGMKKVALILKAGTKTKGRNTYSVPIISTMAPEAAVEIIANAVEQTS